MTWCNKIPESDINTNTSQEEEINGAPAHPPHPFQILPAHDSSLEITSSTVINSVLDDPGPTLTCPSCGHPIQIRVQDQARVLQDLPGLPAGVKFDPTDQEILEHLEAKVVVDSRKLHPLIDEFIPTIEGENGICYTHPEKLPGVSKDGQIRHFFHRPSKAYTTGTRKRRKVHTDATEADGGGGGTSNTGETRWHKTGKTRPIFVGSILKGYKKILVLYTNYGRKRKPEKTNWVMHQYHLGGNEEEKDGELVVSKVFFQTQPRQCGGGGSGVGGGSSSIIEVAAEGRSRTLRHSQNKNQLVVKSTSNFSEFYNAPLSLPPPPLPLGYSSASISYDLRSQIRDGRSPSQIIPNMVVHGDGSSFIHLPSSASKGK